MLQASPITKLTSSRKLVIFSDVHIGAEAHAEREFDEALRWARDERAMVYLNGDIIENSQVEGKIPGEMLLEQSLHPTEQVKLAVDKFRYFSRRGRIVGVTRGNHEARSRRRAMIDLSEILAHTLDVPYLGIGGMVRLQAGRELYPLAIHHGKSGGKNIYTELDRMTGLYPLAELVALGHNHALDARRVQHIGISPEGVEEVRERWQVRTGSYLRYADYAREAVLTPSPLGSPVVSFAAKEHDIDVDVETLRWLA